MNTIQWTPELLASIPDELLLSEAQRRRAKKRTTYTGGAIWKKHNPTTDRCRCMDCTKKRENEDSI